MEGQLIEINGKIWQASLAYKFCDKLYEYASKSKIGHHHFIKALCGYSDQLLGYCEGKGYISQEVASEIKGVKS